MSGENEEEPVVYETTIEDYAATIGVLPVNTSSTPYDVTITDGENLAGGFGSVVKSTARYVNLSFAEATVLATDFSDVFGGTSANSYLVSCDISKLGCTSVLNATRMFQYCTGLKSVKLPQLINVSAAPYMFKNCTAITSADVSAMVNLLNGYSMFEGCNALTSIVAMPGISNAGRMFYGCSVLATIKNFKWAVEELTGTTETESAEGAMPNAFKNCTSLAHIYYYKESDLLNSCNDWRLYKKEGASLKAYDTDGTEQASEGLQLNPVIATGKTLALLFDTQAINQSKELSKPYLYAIPDGSLFDASGENFALLAKDPEKVVTNIEHFKKLSASRKLVIPTSAPEADELVPGCIWIDGEGVENT